MSVLLVDFGSVFWRQWHASAESDIGFAVRGTLQQVQSLAAKFGDEGVGVCLDSPSLFRKAAWPEYKATRSPKDELAVEQLLAAQRLLAEHGYQLFGHEGCEGDDVVAALATSDLLKSAFRVVIATGDKDLAQLITPTCSVWHLGRGTMISSIADGLSLLGIDDPDVDAEKVTREMFVDALALMGDSSDNVLGVTGVGPKRAWSLVRRYGGLDGLRQAVDAQVTINADSPFTAKQLSALTDAFERPDCPLHVARLLVDLLPIFPPLEKAMRDDAHRVFTKEGNPMTHHHEAEPIEHETTNEPKVEVVEPQVERAAPERVERASTSLATFERQLEPQDSRGAYGLAKVIVASRMFSSYGTPEAAMLVIMAGREFGLGAMASLRSFHVVEGKPTMSAQAMMARCLEHPSCKLFRVIRSKCTNEVAVVEVQRHGWPEPETYTWTIDDAKRAGLTGKNNWSKYPRDMLINRCIAEASRFVFPEVMAGMYSPDEFA